MKIKMLLLVLPLGYLNMIYSQETSSLDSTFVDSKYREDQFYAGAGYNLLAHKPSKLSQSGFSSFINLGFIRDFPINEERNFGFALGVGYAFNSVSQNMLIEKNGSGDAEFTLLSDSEVNYSRNIFNLHVVEFPFEIRWRTSTPTKHEFVRVYFGVKVGYVFANKSIYRGDPENQRHSNIKEFNEMQYGLNLSAGYNTWNVHLYYGLNPLFKDGTVTTEGNPIEMRAVKIGLMFYFL